MSLNAVPTQYTRSRNYRNEFFQKLKQYPGDTGAQMWQCGMSTNPRRACESKLARIVCSEAHWQHEDCAGAGRTA